MRQAVSNQNSINGSLRRQRSYTKILHLPQDGLGTIEKITRIIVQAETKHLNELFDLPESPIQVAVGAG
jgi:hypothetical protein